MKNILKTVCVIIGTIIGAGFASGQEVYIFFFSHGIKGIIGIVISTTIFVFKIFILVEIIISIINGIVDTTPPDHSYFF